MPYIDPGIIVPFLALGLVVLVYGAVIHFCVGDARQRGKSPILVCIVVLGFFPLGLVLWLLFRPAIVEDDTPSPLRLEDHRIQ